jgi:hypothetical protein
MKKLSYFIIIFISSLLLLYFLSYFYFYLLIGNGFKNEFFTDTKKLNFYKKHSEIVNHVRFATWSGDPMIIKAENLNEMLYTIINESKVGKTILFQGDSWIQQITDSRKNSSYLKKLLGQNLTIISAGVTSYSPSLMSLQFKLLEDNFKIKPDFLVTYIDQTDIGDETCRYKNLKKFSTNGKLTSVTYEKYPLFVDPFNIDRIIKFSEISLDNTSRIHKVHKYMHYKITKSINKIIKMINYKMNKVSISNKCHWEHIEKNLVSPDPEDIKYFEETVREYFTRITQSINLKKIYVVTHPQYKHMTGEYKLNVSDIVEKISSEFPKINHINFTKIIKKNDSFYLNKKSIWSDDNIHLKHEVLRKKFIKNIVQYISVN